MNYTKRIMALALACLIIISLVPPVRVSAASSKAITFLVNNGILAGKGGGDLGLGDELTREQFVSFLYRMAGEPAVSGSTGFTDVQNTSKYYYKPVLWAKNEGITSGVSKTKFGVGNVLKYEEALTLLYRFGQKKLRSSDMGAGVFPSTYKSYSSWSKAAVSWAYTKKLLQGTSTDISVGSNPCSRDDAAQILYNFYKVFRKTYALVISTYDVYGMLNPNIDLMTKAFAADNVVQIGGLGSKAELKPAFAQLKTAFATAFSQATCIDLCYFYVCSHGSKQGLTMHTPRQLWLAPKELKELTDSYPAKFVVMVEACHSSVFATYFADHKSRADIICSITANEKSLPGEGIGMLGNFGGTKSNYKLYGIASYCWATMLTGAADTQRTKMIDYWDSAFDWHPIKLYGYGNGDGFVSLKELYDATYKKIDEIRYLKDGGEQKIVYYTPSNQPAYCAFGKLS